MLCRPTKEGLAWLPMSLYTDWHLSHHAQGCYPFWAWNIYVMSTKYLLPYPGCSGSQPLGMWALEWCQMQGQANILCLITTGSWLSSLHPHPAAGILGIQVWDVFWAGSAAISFSCGAGKAAKQGKAGAWAGWQLVMATVKHMLFTVFSAEAWLQRNQ